MLKFDLALRCFVRLTASSEARLGLRVSECVAASRVWGSGVGVKIWFGLKARRAVVCVVEGSFRASRLGMRRWF